MAETALNHGAGIDASSNLTRSQLLIWTGQRLQPNEPLYNMILTFRIHGALEPETFQEAFQALVDRCDALRTVFDDVDDVPQQRLLKKLDYRVKVVDLSAESEPEQHLETWLNENRTRSFDLGSCLFESTLIKLSQDLWVWYLNQHHLITDAWSVAVLFKAMQEFYDLAQQGRLGEAGEIPSYGDYVAHERDYRLSTKSRRSEAYWKKKLATPLVPSSFYRKPPSKRSGRTERIPCHLGSDRSAAVKSVAGTNDFRAFTRDMSLFQIFTTVLFAYLYRISGNRDLAIGTPSHNRASAAFRETAGLFIEVFPLQVRVEEGETFLSLFKKVARETHDFLLHATPGASSSEHNRAYDVLLNYITASFDDFGAMPTTSQWIHADHGDRNHLLRLQVHDFDRLDEFVLYFDLNVFTFVGEERQWVGQHYLRLLDALLDDAHQEIAAIPLLSPDEEKRFTVEYNAGVPAEPIRQTVVQLFEQQVETSPDATALVCGEATLSYRDLNAQANGLAHYLIRRGVTPGSRVAVSMTRSIEMVVAVLGILKSGGAYVPVDPEYPQERVSFLLNNGNVTLLLTQAHIEERLPEGAWETLCLETLHLAAATDNPPPRANLEDVAYVIYTSGSTGRPKGVVIGHRGLSNYLSWAKGCYLGGERLDFPLFSSLSFDLTVTSTFVPLIAGSRLVVYEERADEREITIQRVIEDDAVDIIKLTPVHLSLIQSMEFSQSRIKKLVVGGEDFKTDLARTITNRFGGNIEIYNEYGPTEATVACMIHRFDPEGDTAASVPIGRSIDSLEIYVLDDRRNPVPQGVVGEIYIGGTGVANGYLNNDEETAKRFVANPFQPGTKMYGAGDLARWNMDGRVEYLGREDYQVKISGVRVELAEIEAALLDHEEISDCVVEAIERVQTTDAADAVEFCVRCGLPANHPDAELDADRVCSLCHLHSAQQDKAAAYFGSMSELRTIVATIKGEASGAHDCLMLSSGGKDSTYALCQLVELGLNPLVFLFDNGYISEGAKANIRRITDQLGLELVVGQTPAMNAIFVDSLNRFSDVCNGCFKAIYTLSTNLARERGIKYIVTGLSRGQMYETRLVDLFRQGIYDPDEIDRTVVEARKAYHRMDDAVCQSMDVGIFADDRVFDEIKFVDFYRYCEVTLDEMFAYLDKHVPWIRPADTGRSTNCLINEAGIHIHKSERGYHNYALPYSWDVRLGHKERDAARDELDDDINIETVNKILGDIGYQVNQSRTSEKRLVAYYVSSSECSVSELRSYLARRLPGEFIPGHFMRLDRLPLTPNDKVDRKALPKPDDARPKLAEAYAPPASDVETKLAGVWADVLRIEKVGVNDNFFDLGGDSILNIQIVARAKKQGIALTPQQIFEHPTVRELAGVVGDVTSAEAEQGLVEGPVQLTPIQRRFFEEDRPQPAHYNQFVLLEAVNDLDIPLLKETFLHLLGHHDALRSRFVRTDGAWRQFVVGADDLDLSIDSIDLSTVAADEREPAIERFAGELNASLDLEEGKLLRVACIKRGADEPDLVLIAIHHLVVDGVSWWILLDDLGTAYGQLSRREDIRLSPKTTSTKKWAEALAEYARSNRLRQEAEFWTRPVEANGGIPADYPNRGRNDQASTETISVLLDVDETTRLLHDVPGAYRMQIPEVILTALAQSLLAWSGNRHVRLDLEGHGREEIVGGVDLLRTVGWFTTVYPVTLRLEEGTDSGRALQAIKEQLRAVPNRGIGYGVLRYLTEDADVAGHLKDGPQADVLFNYLGQWDQALADSSRFRFARPIMVSVDGRGTRSHLVEINAFVFQGRLRVDWTFSRNFHRTSTIERSADRFITTLRSLILLSLSSRDHGPTPSDFPEADLSQDDLDALIADFGESVE